MTKSVYLFIISKIGFIFIRTVSFLEEKFNVAYNLRFLVVIKLPEKVRIKCA